MSEWRNEINKNAMGGTELMMTKVLSSFSKKELEPFQIIPSRVRELDNSKYRILYCHDLPQDPESHHLKDGGWNKFHGIVFVSNWQQQRYIEAYGIPWSRTIVLQNAITPIKVDIEKRQTDTINIVYHTTPHRGLELLVPAFKKLTALHENVHLHVFSSFDIYGWPERNKPFENLYNEIENSDKMTYYGTVANEEMHKHLAEMHIFAYPSVWLETSCISLMESMSAGLICVHPNIGALYETAANWTYMYNWHENNEDHVDLHCAMLDSAVKSMKENRESYIKQVSMIKSYADFFYDWEGRKHQWKDFLNSVKKMPLELEPPRPTFQYTVT